MPRSIIYLALAALSVLLAFTRPATAQTLTWTGSAGDSQWSSPNNWSPVGTPGPNSNVVIALTSANVVIATGNVAIRSLDFRGTLNLSSGVTLSVQTTAFLRGPLRLSPGATLSGGTYASNGGSNSGFITSVGYSGAIGCQPTARLTNITVVGTLRLQSLAVSWNNVQCSGTLELRFGGYFEFEGDQTLTGTITGDFSTQFLAQGSPGTLTIAPSAVLSRGFYNFISGCSGSPMNLNLEGTIDLGNLVGLRLPRGFNPLSITGAILRPGNSIVVPVMDLQGHTWTPTFAWRVTEEIKNGTVISPSGFLVIGSSTGSTSAPLLPGRATNITFSGPTCLQGSTVIWKDVTLQGTLFNCPVRVSSSATNILDLMFDGDQTLTGSIDLSGILRLSQFTSGTLTIAPDCVIRGGIVQVGNGGGTGAMSLNNLGTFIADRIGDSIDFYIDPKLDTGRFIGDNFGLRNGLDLRGGTWRVSSGSWKLYNTLSNGTVISDGGQLLITSSAEPRLSNVTLIGDFAFDGILRWNNVDLQGRVFAVASSPNIQFEGDQTLNGSIITMLGSISFTQYSAGRLTISPTGSVIGGAVFGTATPTSTPGRAAMALSVLGRLEARAYQGGIRFEIPVDPNYGSFISSGESFLIIPAINLAGGQWTVRSGNFILHGGIENGTINFEGGSIWTSASPSSVPPYFRNLTINGVWSSFPTVSNSVVGLSWDRIQLNGRLNISVATAIQFVGNQTLTGIIEVATSTTPNTSEALTFSGTPGSTITLASGASLLGGRIDFSGIPPFPTFVNNGLVWANAEARTIVMNWNYVNLGETRNGPGNIRFAGTVDLFAGSYTSRSPTAFFSVFTPVNLAGRQFDLRQTNWVFGSMLQNGTIDLSSGTLRFSTSCSPGATVQNMTILGQIWQSWGFWRWDNVNFSGTYEAVGTSEISPVDNQTLRGTFTTSGEGSLKFSRSGTGTLTLAPTAIVRGGSISFAANCGSVPTSIINNGQIIADRTGSTISISAPLTNQGIVSSTGGQVIFNTVPANYSSATKTLTGGTWRALGKSIVFPSTAAIESIAAGTTVSAQSVPSPFTQSNNSSLLSALKTINGSLSLASSTLLATPNGGTLQLGGVLTLDPASTLQITGAFAHSPSATLSVSLAGLAPGSFSRINATTTANILGVIRATFAGAYVPQVADTFSIINAAALTGPPSDVCITNPFGGLAVVPDLQATALRLVVSPDGNVTPHFTLQPVGITACPESAATVTVAASGNGLIYRWERETTPNTFAAISDGPLASGATASGATTPTLIITNIAPADRARYRLTARNGCGTIQSDPVLIEIIAPCSLADIVADSLQDFYCPDGSSGSADLDAFISGFINGTVATADVATNSTDAVRTPNGSVGPEDLDAFIASFIAGC